jgi:membrane-bound serine protease (ClpP class)
MRNVPRGRPSGNRSVRLQGRQLLGLPLLLLIVLSTLGVPGVRAQAGTGQVFVVQVRGEIDLGLAPYLERVLEQAERESARAVLLEIDTPGGRLDAVLQMRDAIVGSPVRTIAYVNRTAFSAGALVAIAANEVYLAPGSAIGAATPVTGAGQPADEKVISAVRTTFKSTAELRGRDPRVAEAMVDPSVEIEGVVRSGQLLTLTTSEAMNVGYADGVMDDRQGLLVATSLSDAGVHEAAPALAENIVRFLTHPVIASLLIAAAFLLILGGLLGDGTGLASAAGLGLLAVFFWGHALAGLAGWEGIVLVVVGLLLLGLEIFVIPGFGVAGILGVLSLATGVFLSLVGGEVVTSEDLLRAGSTVAVAVLMIVAGGIAMLWFLPRSAASSAFILRARLGVSEGLPEQPRANRLATATLLGPATAKARRGYGRAHAESLVGATGVAISDLRPAGVARIGDERIDVVTAGDYISAGHAIEVVIDEGYRRVVRRLPDLGANGSLDPSTETK